MTWLGQFPVAQEGVLPAEAWGGRQEAAEGRAAPATPGAARKRVVAWSPKERQELQGLIQRVQGFLPSYAEALLRDPSTVQALRQFALSAEKRFRGVYIEKFCRDCKGRPHAIALSENRTFRRGVENI